MLLRKLDYNHGLAKPSVLTLAIQSAIIGLGIVVSSADAATIPVNSIGDSGPNCTLRRAVDSLTFLSLNSGCTNASTDPLGTNDVIVFSNSLNNDTITLASPLSIFRSVLISASALDSLTITGTGPAPLVNIDNVQGSVRIRGISLTTTGSNSGAALAVSESTVELRESIISGVDGVSALTASGASLALINTYIMNNSGIALFSNGSALNIQSSRFDSNSNSGMLLFRSNAVVDGSYFSTNEADRGAGIEALSGSTLTLSNSTISRNTATICGAGIYARGAIVHINDSELYGNAVTGPNAEHGGAIYVSGAFLTVEDSFLTTNTAKRHGGAIAANTGGCSDDILVPLGGAFGSDSSPNAPTSAASSSLLESPPITIRNTLIEENTALRGGGLAIDISAGLTASVITGATVKNNTATSKGGGLWLRLASVSASSISQNHAPIGGGIYAGSGTRINSSQLISNTASDHGGGIAIAPSISVSIQNSTISKNLATNQGGGIFSESIDFKVKSSTIHDNTAGYGGGMALPYVIDLTPTLDLNNSTVSSNTATSAGGIYANGSSLSLSQSTLSDNTATSAGGGAFVTIASQVAIEESLLNGNSAFSYGGAMSIVASSNVSINNSTVSGNRSTNRSGGLYLQSGNVVNVNNSTLFANQSPDEGASVTSFFSALSIRNSVIGGSLGSVACEVSNTTLDIDSVSIIEDGSCGALVSGASGLDPELKDNGGRTLTHSISKDSAAHNTGDNSSCLSRDQRGESRARTTNDPCDVGAYEIAAPSGFIVIPLKNGKIVVIPN